MIYKLTFEDGRIDWCTARSEFHLLKSYDTEWNLDLRDIKDLQPIKDEQAKTSMVINTEYQEEKPDEMPEKISLYDLATGDDFEIIASTEYD